MGMNRRSFVKLALGGLWLTALGRNLSAEEAMADHGPVEKIVKNDKTWRDQLDEKSYEVLRHEGTERPFSSALNEEKREGVFVCAGCGLALFPSQYKYNSGTGWPSFYDVLPGHVETKTDYKIGVPRTEYHCARCGGHQGHVFQDGPRPTGLRYCNNGAALAFVPKEE